MYESRNRRYEVIQNYFNYQYRTGIYHGLGIRILGEKKISIGNTDS
jgi:hypothetical protein